jgi:hypothetical protein
VHLACGVEKAFGAIGRAGVISLGYKETVMAWLLDMTTL